MEGGEGTKRGPRGWIRPGKRLVGPQQFLEEGLRKPETRTVWNTFALTVARQRVDRRARGSRAIAVRMFLAIGRLTIFNGSAEDLRTFHFRGHARRIHLH